MKEPPKKSPGITAIEMLLRTLSRFLALSAKYPVADVNRLVALAQSGQAMSRQQRAAMGSIAEMTDLYSAVTCYLFALRFDPLAGMSKEELFSLCDLVLRSGISRGQHALSVGTITFLTYQLWLLVDSPFSMDEGMAYLQSRMDELAPGKGFKVMLCDCENCAKAFMPELIIADPIGLQPELPYEIVWTGGPSDENPTALYGVSVAEMMNTPTDRRKLN